MVLVCVPEWWGSTRRLGWWPQKQLRLLSLWVIHLAYWVSFLHEKWTFFLPTHNSKPLQDLIGECFQSYLQEKAKKQKKWESLMNSFSVFHVDLMCVRHLPRHRDEETGGAWLLRGLAVSSSGPPSGQRRARGQPQGEDWWISPVTPAMKAREILHVSNGPAFKPSELLSLWVCLSLSDDYQIWNHHYQF